MFYHTMHWPCKRLFGNSPENILIQCTNQQVHIIVLKKLFYGIWNLWLTSQQVTKLGTCCFTILVIYLYYIPSTISSKDSKMLVCTTLRINPQFTLSCNPYTYLKCKNKYVVSKNQMQFKFLGIFLNAYALSFLYNKI